MMSLVDMRFSHISKLNYLCFPCITMLSINAPIMSNKMLPVFDCHPFCLRGNSTIDMWCGHEVVLTHCFDVRGLSLRMVLRSLLSWRPCQ